MFGRGLLLLLFCGYAPAGESPKQKRISLTVADAPLAEALHLFEAQSGAVLVFGDTLLQGVRVSCRFTREPAHRVLEGLLGGTPLRATWVQDHRVVLHPLRPSALMTVRGRVLAEDGTALAGVLVHLSAGSRQQWTDGLGRFVFEQVPRESCLLSLSAEGFLPRRLRPDTGSWSGDIVLSAAPALSEEIRVTGGLGQAMTLSLDSGALRISPSSLAAGGAPVVDLFESLRRLPGLDMLELGETGISIRGSAPSENLVLLDNIKLYQLDHAMGYVSALNDDAMGSIDIYKGAPPASYGERTAGVLDFGTRTITARRLAVNAGVKGDSGNATVEFPLGRRVGVLLSARGSFNEENVQSVYERVYEATFNDETETFEEDYLQSDRLLNFSDFVGKISFRPGGNDLISVTAYEGWDDTRERVDVGEVDQWINAYDKSGRWGNEGAALNWRHQWERGETRFSLTGSSYSTDFNTRYLEDWENYLFEQWQTAALVEDEAVSLSHTFLFGRNSLEVGTDYTRLLGRYSERFDGSDDAYTEEWEQHNNLRAFYLQSTWKPDERMGLSAGLRRQSADRSSRGGLEPRFNGWLRLSDHLIMRLGFSRQHQYILRSPDTLNYFEGVVTWFVAEDDFIQAGYAENEQWGLVYERGTWLVESWIFRKHQIGGIATLFDPLGERPEFQQSEDRIKGFELFVRHATGPFTAELGYTWRRDRVIRDINTGRRLDHPGDRDTPHQVKVGLYAKKGPWQWQAVWRYASGRPYGVPQVLDAQAYADYFQLDLAEFLEDEYEDGPIDEDARYLAPSRKPNARRLPDIHRLDLGLRYTFTLHKAVGEVGVVFLNSYDQDNTLYRYYELEENGLFPVDVKGFGLKPVVDLRIRF